MVERELGHGGMATVYLARDLKHDREVAVKVLRPELTAVLGRERFLAEVALTAKLDHPHVLTLIDSGEAGGTLYYVLPYVRGESLRQRLAAEQQLPVDEAVRIALEKWPNTGAPGELSQVLPSPRHFEQVAELVTEEHIRKSFAWTFVPFMSANGLSTISRFRCAATNNCFAFLQMLRAEFSASPLPTGLSARR